MPKGKEYQGIRLLALVGDQIGANCLSGGRKVSILEKFRKYGWQVTIAGAARDIQSCPYAVKLGLEPPDIDCLVEDIRTISDYDVISVLPGPTHRGLVESEAAMRLLRQAAESGLVVSAWCRGVRVLAAADVLQRKQVVGHSDDQQIIEQAGGIFVGHDHLPITDGLLVTGARSYHYRAKNADAIKKAVDANR